MGYRKQLGKNKTMTTLIKFDFALTYMKVAKLFAEQHSKAERLKVGCVIVKDTRIVSYGYNGTPPGWSNICEIEIDGKETSVPEVYHAETNALTKLIKSSESSEGAILFVTHSPCLHCAKFIHQSGIARVYYGEIYRDNENKKRKEGLKFLSDVGIAATYLPQENKKNSKK